MDDKEAWRLGHRPELDALRGVAVLLVVTSHVFVHWFMLGGAVGVTIFFTLSGFLITSLLLEETARSGRVDLRGFYTRRAVRLFPALAAFLATLLMLGYIIGRGFPKLLDVLPSMLYVQNFVALAPDYGGHFTIGHTWSLSVEEQFYLVMPLLLIGLVTRLPRRQVTFALGALTAAGVAVRLAVYLGGGTWTQIYYSTETNACLLLAGATLASWMSTRRVGGGLPRVALVLCAGIAFFLFARMPYYRYSFALVPLLTAAVTVPLIALLVSGSPGPRVPNWLVLVGQRSYGLYLWHYPLLYNVRQQLPQSWLITVGLLAAAWGLTLLSWQFIEQPTQQWRKRRATAPDTGRAPAPPAGLIQTRRLSRP